MIKAEAAERKALFIKARRMLRMEKRREKFRRVALSGPKGRPKVLVKAVVRVAKMGARVVMEKTRARKAQSPHRPALPRWEGCTGALFPPTTTYFWVASTRL